MIPVHRRTITPLLLGLFVAAVAVPLRGHADDTDQAQVLEPATVPTSWGLHYYVPYTGPQVAQVLQADVCIYGGTSAGVAAALQLSRMGKTAIVLEPGEQIGGLSSGGLSATDMGIKGAIGGIAHEFYRRLGQKYGYNEVWRFEPHVAEQVFQDMIEEAGAPVYYHQFLKSVEKSDGRIVSVTMESGLTVRAGEFIDASYEGDLMAKAGVTYCVGRESNATYGEYLNGVQVGSRHQFDLPIDPYVVAGDPDSGLLPGINVNQPGVRGSGDRSIQAYTFRLCLTRDPLNRIPFTKPIGYDRDNYILLARYLEAGENDPQLGPTWASFQVFGAFDRIAHHKVDVNNFGPVSIDFIGGNYDWPNADYLTRERVFQDHVTYEQGLMWFLGHDNAVPSDIRAQFSEWGLCRDEFPDTNGWSPELYVREARRMLSDYVMTEHNCRGQVPVDDSIGLASYAEDSHNCERFVDKSGHVRNEGNVQATGISPYPISYRAITPRQDQCTNLFVPVCMSATHIAYGSIRMEPVFLLLGQSAGTAAAICLDENIPVQHLVYAELRTRLVQDGQVLQWRAPSHYTQMVSAGAAQVAVSTPPQSVGPELASRTFAAAITAGAITPVPAAGGVANGGADARSVPPSRVAGSDTNEWSDATAIPGHSHELETADGADAHPGHHSAASP